MNQIIILYIEYVDRCIEIIYFPSYKINNVDDQKYRNTNIIYYGILKDRYFIINIIYISRIK